MKVAKLEKNLNARLNNPHFNYRWLIVEDWNQKSRYPKHSKQKALEMYEAIKDPTHGVLQWLQQHW